MSLLHGFRILSVEQYGAGPFGTGYLAALGAEVIKIEQPEEAGDVARHVGPHFDATLPPTAQSLFFQSLNTGKKSICLSLRDERGRALLRRLAARSHALVSNVRGDVPKRLGLTYEQLKEVNPAIVCGHLTGYGREGERAHWPGYDYLMQAEAGYFSLTGEPGTPPARMGLSIVDYMTGVVLSLGVVSGILDAQRSGKGCDVDVSLFDVALHNLNYLACWYLNADVETGRQPRSAHPSLVPCQLYRTRDGWVYVMCNKEKFWPLLCAKLGRPEWAESVRYRTFADRLQHREELTAMLDEALSTRTTDEWMAVFAGSVPAAPVLSVAKALDNPYVRAHDRIAAVRGAEGRQLQVVSSPLRTSKGQPAVRPSPALGEHTHAVLIEAGVSEQELDTLRAAGVLR